jgi:hypothetical protein
VRLFTDASTRAGTRSAEQFRYHPDVAKLSDYGRKPSLCFEVGRRVNLGADECLPEERRMASALRLLDGNSPGV